MDLRDADVFIVSIRGRGHGLAAELRRRGLEVILLDLTSQIGVWPAEDQEGPFGFFKAENISPTFVERLHEEDPYQALERGFTFWTPKGVLEMKGPMTRYLLGQWGWKEDWIDSLANEKPSLQFFDVKKGLGSLWPLVMAHTLACTYEVKAMEAPITSRKLPLSAEFSIRFSTRQGLEKSLQWLVQLGVQVLSKTQILDLSQIGTTRWDGFELKGEVSGICKAPRFVWCLSSQETRFYSEKVFDKIYKSRILEPQWCWVRYRGRLPEISEVQILPLHFVMIRDPDSPWTHDNLMIVQRTSSRDQFDFWMKIPALQRFNKEYLTQGWEKIRNNWTDRLSHLNPTLVSYPQEYYYPYEELGPSSFPIFGREHGEKKHAMGPAKNSFFHHPEQWQDYSWGGQYEVQLSLGEKILQSWKEEQLRKEERRDREIHSP